MSKGTNTVAYPMVLCKPVCRSEFNTVLIAARQWVAAHLAYCNCIKVPLGCNCIAIFIQVVDHKKTEIVRILASTTLLFEYNRQQKYTNVAICSAKIKVQPLSM